MGPDGVRRDRAEETNPEAALLAADILSRATWVTGAALAACGHVPPYQLLVHRGSITVSIWTTRRGIQNLTLIESASSGSTVFEAPIATASGVSSACEASGVFGSGISEGSVSGVVVLILLRGPIGLFDSQEICEVTNDVEGLVHYRREVYY